MRNTPALVVTVLLGIFTSVSGLHSATAADRQVSVTGVCQRRVAPDRGSVVLTADFLEKDLKLATERASNTYDRVKTAVQKLGLESLELKTAEYTLNEVKEWEKERQVMKGYRARLGLEVSTSNIQRLGEVLAIASREGVRNVGNLTTYLSDEKQLHEHFACLQAAAENARAKAEKLAVALNAKVGETVMISENHHAPSSPSPEPFYRGAMNMKSSREMSPPEVEAGQQMLSLTIQVTFGLK